MSDKMTQIVGSMCQNLMTAILEQAARPANRYSAAPFYGMWFQSPLANNDYVPRVATTAAAPQPVVKQERVVADIKPYVKKGEPGGGGEADNGRKRTKLIDFTEMSETGRPNNTTIDLVHARENGAEVATVTTMAYDGRSKIGTDTLNKLYGTEQRIAVETLKDSMERRFASQQTGTVSKIAQTLLVLVLEPLDLSMEMSLKQRFDTNVVVENLLYIAAQQNAIKNTPGFFDGPDDEDDDEGGERVREFRSQFKKMTVNIFARFPELAIECNESSTLSMLKAVFSFWACCETLFENCRALPQSESARTLREPYRQLLEQVAGDRSQLLYAAITSNIEGIGPRHWHQFRELFSAALLSTYLHVSWLHKTYPDNASFARATPAILATYERVHVYQHSSLAQPRAAAAKLDFL